MRAKHITIIFCSLVTATLIFILYGHHKPTAIQDIVYSTHQQIRNFQDNLRDAESKILKADEKYLTSLGFTENPRLYPKNVWHNTSLPVIVSYVMEGQESQAVGLIHNILRFIPNNTILIYNLGLGNYGLRTLLNYCNNSHCQVMSFNLMDYPSHVEQDISRAFRPLVIQDALQRVGAIFFLESNYRFSPYLSAEKLYNLFEEVAGSSGILTWSMPMKNAVSSLTHKKMFEYFHTKAENFLFLEMVSADMLLIVNNKDVHQDIMLPWVQCALTQDCIVPIGAQSGGCKFNKKPQYRYSGCHSYDASALNIILGIKFKLDSSQYTYYENESKFFATVELQHAVSYLESIEQNVSTDAHTQAYEIANLFSH